MKKLLSALSAFKNLMDANEIIDYLDMHSAMRTCSNGNKILKKIKKDINRIKIISGKKESNVVENDISEYIGKSTNYCFIDVGGGSTRLLFIKILNF